MKTVCEVNKCCGCMACTNVCKFNAITVEDEIEYYNAKIDENLCSQCNQCHRVCPQNHEPDKHAPIEWHQGWAQEKIRSKSSSGGLSMSVAKAFIMNGGCVAGCYYKNGDFLFKIVDTVDELDEFTGSKYVKSNPGNIYSLIQKRLEKQKVLFIGLPCQVAAVINFIKKEQRQNLYTIDLVCHGTPSPHILDLFLNGQGYKLSQVKAIKFREKGNFGLSDGEVRIAPKGMRDRYTICYLNSLIYTENCYQCKFACTERVGDLTLGDSWGTELSKDEQGKGISLALIQNEKGKELIDKADITLLDVSLNKAVAANHQLKRPSVIPEKRNKFFNNIRKGKSFNSAYFSCFKIDYLKQEIKKRLVNFRRGGGRKASTYNIIIKN